MTKLESESIAVRSDSENMKTTTDATSSVPPDASKDDAEEARIDEALDETFPASDPPAYIHQVGSIG